jgi:hypothetical protein
MVTVRLPSIREFHWSLADLNHILGGQQPHAVYQCQICHGSILRRSPLVFRVATELFEI